MAVLAGAENLLRTSRLSQLCYHGARLLDTGMQRRFNYYLSETSARLTHIDRILLGEEPVWDANPHADDPEGAKPHRTDRPAAIAAPHTFAAGCVQPGLS